ncbi:hypothetical protein D9M68_748310 [compost metagenome]
MQPVAVGGKLDFEERIGIIPFCPGVQPHRLRGAGHIHMYRYLPGRTFGIVHSMVYVVIIYFTFPALQFPACGGIDITGRPDLCFGKRDIHGQCGITDVISFILQIIYPQLLIGLEQVHCTQAQVPFVIL